MDPLCSSFGKGIVLPFLASLAFIGIPVDAGIKGYFKCTPPPPVTCETNHLPYVGNGSFDCPPDSKVSLGNTCYLTCEVGFYPASTDQAVCEAGIGGGQRGNWSQGNFSCKVITCNSTDLPEEPAHGSFDCPEYTTVFDTCNLTCDVGFYPAPASTTTCEPEVSGDPIGHWSNGTFECRDVRCDLPVVPHGYFDCPGQTSLNNTCNLTCDVGFYPASATRTTCELGVKGHPTGNWSNGNFECHVITCERDGLPEVRNGSFDCTEDTSLNSTCNLMCGVGFYLISANTTTCEPGVRGDPIGHWSNGTFECHDCSDPNNWGEHIYRFYVTNMTNETATDKCQDVGSAIAYIESLEENNFVHELVKKCAPDNGEWAGWTWIDADVSDNSRYTNWETGQPGIGINAPCQMEQCVSMKYDSGEWHDQCCNRTFYSVCEQNIMS